MDISLDKTENNEALIKISLKQEDYQQGVDQKIKDFSKKANLKGFRPGKVPPGLIRKMYGKSILAEEINRILGEELTKYMRESDLRLLGEPMPRREEMEAIDWETQQEFEFTYDAGYAGDFDLKVDKKIKVEKATIKVDDAVIDETIGNLQRQFGETSPAEEVSEGDTVYGQIVAESVELDREISIDTRECEKSGINKFKGLKVDDTLTIDGKKFFKDADYITRLAGLTADQVKTAKAKYEFTVKGITHTVPSEINQELFDKTFGAGNVETEEVFKEKVTETLAQNYERESDQLFFLRVRDELIDKAGITLPDAFLKVWLKATNENMTDELLDTEYDQYAKELRWSLVSEQIASDNDLKVEHEDVMAEARAQILQQFGGPAIAEQLGDQLDQFANNYLQGENGNNYMKVFNQVKGTKVFEFLKGEITVKDKEVTLEEFRKLV